MTLAQKCSAQKTPLHPSPKGNNLGRSEPVLLWPESPPLSQARRVLSAVITQQPRRTSAGLTAAALAITVREGPVSAGASAARALPREAGVPSRHRGARTALA